MAEEDRIDRISKRIDDLYPYISMEFRDVHDRIDTLQEAVNDRVHLIEADMNSLKRPWILLDTALSGWKRTAAVGATTAGAVAAWMKLFGGWPF